MITPIGVVGFCSRQLFGFSIRRNSIVIFVHDGSEQNREVVALGGVHEEHEHHKSKEISQYLHF